ncbi:ROK family transcriptional regulator [Naasia lichenicola]|nr:ROK family transcriptional regulator [Naasia lichenicola]
MESTARGLRLRHRSLVLSEVLRYGPTTRATLSAALGLSPGTISNVLSDLSAEGLVQEESSRPTSGRPTMNVSIRPEGAYLVGADLAERSVRVVVYDLAFSQHANVVHPISSRSDVVAELSDNLHAAIDDAVAVAGSPALYGVGFALPGVIEHIEGSPDDGTPDRITIYAQSLGWPDTPLEALYGRSDVPVIADNAPKALALAELWFGAARGIDNCLIVLLARGVGLGIISNGQIFQGHASSAGEWGHTKLSLGGPLCNCGEHGCVEAYVGSIAIANRWREHGGQPSDNEQVAYAELLAAVEAGDPVATAALDETLELIGTALSDLVNLLNPERIIIAGANGVQLTSEQIAVIERATRAHALHRPASQFDMVHATVSGDAGALGAAILAAQRLIRLPLATGRM